MTDPVFVTCSTESDSLFGVTVGDRDIAIAVSDGEVFAFENSCSHEQCPLTDGDVEGGAVTCACHFAEFDLATGDVLVGPATRGIEVFPARKVAGGVELTLDLPADSPARIGTNGSDRA